jgi:signal transduction histidine kinase/ligand-binding sensor domain-containing protein
MTRTAGCLFFLLLLLLLLPGAGQAQGPLTRQGPRECYLYTQLDDDDGLPQNSVMAAFVDSLTGFLWIATQGGIARYDGHTVLNYNARDDRFSKRFVTIFGTTTGQVFSLAIDGSIFTFRNNEFLYVPDNKLKTSVYPFIYFRGSLCDTSQLNRIGYLGNLPGHERWPMGSSAIAIDRNVLIACGNQQVLIYRNNQLEKTVPLPGIANYRIVKQEGVIFFIDNNLEGYRLDILQGSLIRLGKDGRLPVMPGGESIEQVYYAPYFDCLSGQINCWARDTFYQLHIVQDKIGVEAAYHVPGMPDDAVVGFIQKKKDVIIIGSSSKGIYLYKIQQFKQILKDAGRYTSIYAQILADSVRLITSQSWIYNLETDKPEQNIYTTQARQIRSFSKDREGMIYYSWANKLYRFNPVNHKPVIAFPCDNCHDINFTFYDTLDNRFWMMSPDKNGYWENNIFYPVTWAKYDSLPPIVSSVRHTVGYPLIISTSNGIWYYAPERKQWLPYPETLGRIYRYFTPIKNSIRIVTSFGEGFALWNMSTRKLTELPTDRNGYLKFVHTLIPDHRGYLWATTNKGLFRYRETDVLTYNKASGQDLYYEYYDRKEGLQTNEFNGAQYPIFNWWNNHLLLSTINGITIFMPDSMPGYNFDEPLYVESVFRSDGEKINMSGGNDKSKFTSAERDLKFLISTAAWHNVYGLIIEYRLDGQDLWKQVDTRKMEIVMSAMSAGNHMLQIRKKKGFTEGDYVYCTFSFNIERKYYEYPFFIFILAFCALGILMIFSRLRQLRLIKVNKKLSHMVSKKTKELQQSNLQLKQSLTKIEQSQNFRLRLISMLLHDIATPLSSVEKISDMLTNHYAQLDSSTRIEGAGKINRTIRELQALSRQLIDWAQVNLYTGEPVLKHFTLQSLVEEVNMVMVEHAFTDKQNEYTNDYKPDEKIVSDPTVLKHIILNVLFNANKYTQQGKIGMRLYRENSSLHVVIRDTGTGMYSETAAQLNAYTVITQSEIKSGTAMEVGWGLGYQIIFDLLAILKGTLQVNSIPNEGTEIHITIPMKPQTKGSKK